MIWRERNLHFCTAKAPNDAKNESGFYDLRRTIFARESPVWNMLFFIKICEKPKGK